ncbi:MAG: tetratricopeptide repeat protein [Candidatus Sericytochromatia bacterium]|nr:tetratricopeptide repeat protein [Candidatus Tanganyikabacteria bacterium]
MTADTGSVVRRLVGEGRGEAALQLASAAFKAGKFREAEAIAQAALDAGYLTHHVYYFLAACARATRRPELAVDMARVGIALDPAPDPARRELGAALLELGRGDEAAAVLEAVPPAARDRLTRERLGLAYAVAGQRNSARAVFKALLAEDPGDERAREALLRLAPRPAGQALDAIRSRLSGDAGIVFDRLREGPCTEAELGAALAAAGRRKVLLKAIVRDLAERTRAGGVPLVVVEGDRVRLDLGVLDIAPEFTGVPVLDVSPARGV